MVNKKELLEMNDLYRMFTAQFDHDESFADWWNDMEEMFQDILGDKHAEWLKWVIRAHWEASPIATAIMDDRFYDEVRKLRDA